MRGLQTAIAILALGALLLAPLGQAQDTSLNNPDESTPTTLYFHIFDTFNKFVINTQPMDAEYFEVGGNNFPTFTGTPVNDAYGGDVDLNTVYGYSTAGPVEYGFTENGKPRFHPERGIAADVIIDKSVQPIVYLYLDVRDVQGSDAAPNYMPELTFRVLVQEGDDPGVGANLDAGKDIMGGQVTFDLANFDIAYDEDLRPVSGGVIPDPPIEDGTVLVPGNSNVPEGQTGASGYPLVYPDENGLVEVQIPLTDLLGDRIPKSEAYNVRIDWFQNPQDSQEDDQFAEGFFRFYADPDHLSRLEMNIMNPVYLSFIHPQVAANTLLIHAGANSPWGTYDLDSDTVTLEIDGPIEPRNVRYIAATNEHVHGLHDQDAQFTYLWDFRDENAPDGEYTIHMSVSNDAGTATATGTAKFIIEGDTATGIDTEGQEVEATGQGDDVETPGVGVLPVVGLIGLALVAARRRWNA